MAAQQRAEGFAAKAPLRQDFLLGISVQRLAGSEQGARAIEEPSCSHPLGRRHGCMPMMTWWQPEEQLGSPFVAGEVQYGQSVLMPDADGHRCSAGNGRARGREKGSRDGEGQEVGRGAKGSRRGGSSRSGGGGLGRGAAPSGPHPQAAPRRLLQRHLPERGARPHPSGQQRHEPGGGVAAEEGLVLGHAAAQGAGGQLHEGVPPDQGLAGALLRGGAASHRRAAPGVGRHRLPPAGVAQADHHPLRPGAHLRPDRPGAGRRGRQGQHGHLGGERGGGPQPALHRHPVPPGGGRRRQAGLLSRRHREQDPPARARGRRPECLRPAGRGGAGAGRPRCGGSGRGEAGGGRGGRSAR